MTTSRKNGTKRVKPIDNDGIITTPNAKTQLEPKGVGYVFFTYLKKHLNKTLQIDGCTGEEDTFGSVLQRSIRIALKMQKYGIKPNDTVSICTLNHIHTCVPVFASLFIGAKITFFDEQMHLNEARFLMKQIDPKIVFVSLKSLNFIKTLLESINKTTLIIVFGPTDTYVNFFDLLSPCADENNFVPVQVEETTTAFIFFSSGTCDLPKSICLSHRGYLGQIAVVLDLEDSFERLLIFSSLYWSSYLVYWGIAIIKGCCNIIINLFEDMQPIWHTIVTYKPTFIFIHPLKMRKLYESKPAEANIDSIKKICIVGDRTLEQDLINYRKMFSKASVVNGYGLTEAGLVLCFPSITKKDLCFISEKPKSMGCVLNGISYKVADLDTEEALKPYQKGELRINTKNVLTEYYKLDSSEAFDSDGWFRTGDLVYYDEDYYFYFVERFKELIKYTTWHVTPRTIENVLMKRTDVSAACVIGIPHDVDQEHPMAVIELKNTTTIDGIEEDINQYVKQALGNNFKLKGGVKIVDKIPITPSGKIDVRKLKSMIFNEV